MPSFNVVLLLDLREDANPFVVLLLSTDWFSVGVAALIGGDSN